ncbi:MAG: hypothetical protein NZ473_08610, partial [Candidatus Kapabacteria bacterium]|nr:hypothetical protein [Candidatus Kapabacteria bacterium]
LGGFLSWGERREGIPATFTLGIATEIGIAPPLRRERIPATGEERTTWLPSPQYVLLSTEVRYTQGLARPTVLLAAEIAPLGGIALRGGTTVFGDELGQARWFPLQRLGGGLAVQLPHTLQLPIYLQADYAISYEYSSPTRLAHTVSLTAQLAP